MRKWTTSHPIIILVKNAYFDQNGYTFFVTALTWNLNKVKMRRNQPKHFFFINIESNEPEIRKWIYSFRENLLYHIRAKREFAFAQPSTPPPNEPKYWFIILVNYLWQAITERNVLANLKEIFQNLWLILECRYII